MNKLLIMSTAFLLTCTSFAVNANAEQKNETEKSNEVDSVQIEKNNVPNTTATGDYLKPQSKKSKTKEFKKNPDGGGLDLES